MFTKICLDCGKEYHCGPMGKFCADCIRKRRQAALKGRNLTNLGHDSYKKKLEMRKERAKTNNGMCLVLER